VELHDALGAQEIGTDFMLRIKLQFFSLAQKCKKKPRIKKCGVFVMVDI
jgi:hypothetical protein